MVKCNGSVMSINFAIFCVRKEVHIPLKLKNMNKKLRIFIGLAIISIGVAFYIYNKPHRDVQSTKVDFTLSSQSLVDEFIKDQETAIGKYLTEDGESKIVKVNGPIFSISKDMNNQQVLVLKTKEEESGVSCTFMESTNGNTTALKKGDVVSIKGVIRSGAEHDLDLELYEDAILEKCDIVTDN